MLDSQRGGNPLTKPCQESTWKTCFRGRGLLRAWLANRNLEQLIIEPAKRRGCPSFLCHAVCFPCWWGEESALCPESACGRGPRQGRTWCV